MRLRTFSDARYPSDLSSFTAYTPKSAAGAHDQKVTFIPRVPDALTRARALARSGAFHRPSDDAPLE